jgi:alpha-methylacyl-CoA racemase
MTVSFAEIFKTRTRDEWTAIFEGKDACVAPVLELDEVDQHPHNRERGLLINLDGALQPFPAPRLSRTPGKAQKPGKPRGSETREILKELGYSTEEIEAFSKNDIVE